MNFDGFSRRHREGLLSAVSAGFFLVLIGMLFVIKPNLYYDTSTFFNNFNVTSAVPHTQIQLPAPSSNSTVRNANLSVYSAVEAFSLAWGIFMIVLLVLRFAFHSSWRRKAENISNIVFWFGVVYLVQTWLINPTNSNTYQAKTWFEFWSMVIVLL